LEQDKKMSAQRLAAIAAMHSRIALRQEELEAFAGRQAAMVQADLEARRRQEPKWQQEVRSARETFATSIGVSPRRVATASSSKRRDTRPGASEVAATIQATARDCLRREELMRAEQIAAREASIVERLHASTEHMRQDHAMRIAGKRQQENEGLARRLELEQQKEQAVHSFAEENEAMRAKMEAMRKSREEKQAKLVKDRREEKDKKKLLGAEEKGRQEQARQVSYEKRRKVNAEFKRRAQDEASAETLRRMRMVCKEADAKVLRYADAMEQFSHRAELSGVEIDQRETNRAHAAEAQRLQDRLEQVQKIAKAARDNLASFEASIKPNSENLDAK